MSPNSDNATARFLFAILKQKNLKDIDWNLVAEDPVLIQPIPNGHAARMRYSRFRSTILGHESTKRSRTPSSEKARVSKSKKDSRAKKEIMVKSESGASLSSLAQFSPASTTSPYLNDNKDDFNTRFLTPCSDDMAHTLPVRHGSLSYAPGLERNADLMYDQNSLAHSPAYSAFDAAYDMSAYSNGPGELQPQDPTLLDCGGNWGDNFHDQPLF